MLLCTMPRACRGMYMYSTHDAFKEQALSAWGVRQILAACHLRPIPKRIADVDEQAQCTVLYLVSPPIWPASSSRRRPLAADPELGVNPTRTPPEHVQGAARARSGRCSRPHLLDGGAASVRDVEPAAIISPAHQHGQRPLWQRLTLCAQLSERPRSQAHGTLDRLLLVLTGPACANGTPRWAMITTTAWQKAKIRPGSRADWSSAAVRFGSIRPVRQEDSLADPLSVAHLASEDASKPARRLPPRDVRGR